MEKHTCKLCFRNFSNGRALGGHMRSHVVNTKAQLLKDSSSSSPSASSSSTSSREEEDVEGKGMGLGYGLRENPKKSFRLVDPEFSSTFAAVDAGSSVIVQDRESETESSRAPTHRRRSKRARRAQPEPPEPEPVSSVSDTTPEEDVALCLMMLSRDIWAPKTKSEGQQQSDGSDEDEQEEEEERIAARSRNHPVSGRSKYQCGTCKKVFRSYQALGGHRASHKKMRGCVPPAAVVGQIQIQEGESSDANAEKVQHECPVCFRVFSSGQALGGHKRSHLSSSTATIIITSPSVLPPPSPSAPNTSPAIVAKFGKSLIDLNLPAPMEKDTELSAVSYAEFVLRRPSN